jgi:hypothetical protein
MEWERRLYGFGNVGKYGTRRNGLKMWLGFDLNLILFIDIDKNRSIKVIIELW